MIFLVVPGTAITRLIKCPGTPLGTGSGQARPGSSSSCGIPQTSPSTPAGGWKTMTSPRAGFEPSWVESVRPGPAARSRASASSTRTGSETALRPRLNRQGKRDRKGADEYELEDAPGVLANQTNEEGVAGPLVSHVRSIGRLRTRSRLNRPAAFPIARPGPLLGETLRRPPRSSWSWRPACRFSRVFTTSIRRESLVGNRRRRGFLLAAIEPRPEAGPVLLRSRPMRRPSSLAACGCAQRAHRNRCAHQSVPGILCAPSSSCEIRPIACASAASFKPCAFVAARSSPLDRRAAGAGCAPGCW